MTYKYDVVRLSYDMVWLSYDVVWLSNVVRLTYCDKITLSQKPQKCKLSRSFYDSTFSLQKLQKSKPLEEFQKIAGRPWKRTSLPEELTKFCQCQNFLNFFSFL